MNSKCLGLSWLGVKTDKFLEMKNFYGNVLGMELVEEELGFLAFKTDNGDVFEIFDESLNEYPHFTSAPVAGFLVEDIEIAKADMEKSGIEFIGGIEGDPKKSQWAHFKGPDGNVYELKRNATS